MADKYYPNIDLLKGYAIICVIITHSLSSASNTSLPYNLFYIRQCIPIFFILMGVTLAITYTKKQYLTIDSMYTIEYFIKRGRRFLIPFIIIFIVMIVVGYYNGGAYFGIDTLLGHMPIPAPGGYFIALIFEFSLIGPIIYYFYRRHPASTLTMLLLSDFLFELSAQHWGLYGSCIIRYFWCIGLGLWISDDLLKIGKINLLNRKYWPLYILLPIAVWYLIDGLNVAQPIPFLNTAWGTQNFLSASFALFIVVLLLNLDLSKFKNTILYNRLRYVGKSSYHIYLFQMLFFGMNYSYTVYNVNIYISFIFNITLCCVFGVTFYWIENRNFTNIFKNMFIATNIDKLLKNS